MNILGIIPSRYGSTRFPAKALADIKGKSMVQRVYEQASKCSLLTKVVVATDNSEIHNHVEQFGGEVCMTSADHQSGTDRCYEALTKQTETYDYVINIQGDEPFISPQQIELLANLLDGETELATLIKPIANSEDVHNPNVVKAIFDNNVNAIYFSRNPIPFVRSHEKEKWNAHHTFHKHIGIYAYRSDILEQITKLRISPLEKAESLEQLRWLENGYTIKTAITNLDSTGIDTPEDLIKLLDSLDTIKKS